MAKRFDFQDDLSDFLMDLDGVTADLEDIRDDAQDESEGCDASTGREAVKNMDAALSLLAQAAEILEKWE